MMFTIYNAKTKTKVLNIPSAARAEVICGASADLFYDDTCKHGTAYELCNESHPLQKHIKARISKEQNL